MPTWCSAPRPALTSPLDAFSSFGQPKEKPYRRIPPSLPTGPPLSSPILVVDHVNTLRSLQEAWTNLGSLLRDWGKGEKALAAFDSALSLDTAYVHAYHLRGLCRHGMGDHRGAQADFMRGLFYDGQVWARVCG